MSESTPYRARVWQKEITEEIIKEAINKKEAKIESYISKTNLPQWLLLVIGGVGESSYLFENKFDNPSIYWFPIILGNIYSVYLLIFN